MTSIIIPLSLTESEDLISIELEEDRQLIPLTYSIPALSIITSVSLSEDQTILPMDIQQDQDLISLGLATPVQIHSDGQYFDGSYEYIPSDESQTISISHLTARQNIIIEPIPSNYGKIIYNGSFIRVE